MRSTKNRQDGNNNYDRHKQHRDINRPRHIRQEFDTDQEGDSYEAGYQAGYRAAMNVTDHGRHQEHSRYNNREEENWDEEDNGYADTYERQNRHQEDRSRYQQRPEERQDSYNDNYRGSNRWDRGTQSGYRSDQGDYDRIMLDDRRSRPSEHTTDRTGYGGRNR